MGGRTRTRKATRHLRDRCLRPRRKSRIRRIGSRQEHFSGEPVESFRVRERSAGRSDRERDRPGPSERPHQVHRDARGQPVGQDAGGRLDLDAPGGQPCWRQRGAAAGAPRRARIPVGARAPTIAGHTARRLRPHSGTGPRRRARNRSAPRRAARPHPLSCTEITRQSSSLFEHTSEPPVQVPGIPR